MGLFWDDTAKRKTPDIQPPTKPKLRFVVLDLYALTKNLPRNEHGEIDQEVRQAISASIKKGVSIQEILETAETCYYKARQAYQFGATSYTHEALSACLMAKEALNRAIRELMESK